MNIKNDALSLAKELEIVGNYVFDKEWSEIERIYGRMSVKLLAQTLYRLIEQLENPND